MKIIEQYLVAVGSKLPLKGREDIKQELRSLLLDELEAQYGAQATEEQAASLLTGFGSPSQVAARYRDSRGVIAPELTEFYYLLISIVGGALGLAFLVLFAVEALSGEPSWAAVRGHLLQVPQRFFPAALGALGMLTLVFMVITRFSKPGAALFKDDWTVAELKAIELEPEKESPAGLGFGIAFSAGLGILLLVHPGIVAAAEELFLQSTLPLGHRLVLPVFSGYALFLALLWLVGVIPLAVRLVAGMPVPWTKILEKALDVLGAATLLAMLLDSRLYALGEGFWALGFGAIFAIVLVVELAELVAEGVKWVRGRLEARS